MGAAAGGFGDGFCGGEERVVGDVWQQVLGCGGVGEAAGREGAGIGEDFAGEGQRRGAPGFGVVGDFAGHFRLGGVVELRQALGDALELALHGSVSQSMM